MYTAEDLKFFLDLRYWCDIAAFCVAGWSFLSNIALITSYFVMKRIHKKFIPNFIFFTQGLVGILISAYTLLSTLPNFVTVWWVQGRYYNIARIVLEDYSIFLHLGLLTIAAIERSLAAYKSFLHFRLVTLSKSMICVAVACILAFVPCAVMMFYTKPKEGHIKTKEFYIIYGSVRVGIAFFGTVCVLVMLLLSHYKMQQRARDAARRSSLTKKMNSLSRRLRSDVECSVDLGEDNSLKELRSLTVLILCTVVFAFSYLPTGVLSVVRNIVAEWLSFYEMLIVEIVVFLLYVLLVTLNPLLIFCLQYDYRTVLWRKCCCCCSCCKDDDGDGEVIVEMLSKRHLPEITFTAKNY